MARIARTSAVIFLAASSVYPGHVNTAIAQNQASVAGNGGVRLLEDAADPFGDPLAAAPTTAPTTQSTTEMKVGLTGASINFQDTNLVQALNMLAAQNGRNIVPSRDVKGTVTLSLSDVTLEEALAAICKQNDLVTSDEGPVIYVYTRKEYQEVQKANRRQATQVFTMHYIPVTDADKMVRNLLSPEGKTVISTVAKSGVSFDNSSAGGNDGAGNNLLVVTDYEENLANVAKLVQEIDVRPQQILVEATILRASLTEDNALGVDFTVLGGVDFSTIGTNNGQFQNANVAPGAPLADRNSSVGTGNNFTSGINNGVKVGFVSSNVAVFLSALEETTDTAVLANPKVLVLNKQKGEVKVIRKDPYRGKIVQNEDGQTQEVETQETGTKLVFRPYIGNDGYIRLEVHPEDSTALAARSADLPPSSLSTEATTNVLVKDGRTIVIGGLFRESSTTTRSQIPVLGNIPVVGNLFRKKQDNTVREEIIILLTPHIVKDDEAYAKQSEKELRDVERIRVGVRRGMMPWGRERLAESAYENAVKELAKPNPNKRRALWHLNVATNLNPKFLEAIDLKERVSGRVITSVDNSSIRSFVRDSVLVSMAAGDGAGGQDGLATGPVRIYSPRGSEPAAVAGAPATQPTTAHGTHVPASPLAGGAATPSQDVPAVPVDPTPVLDTLPAATVTVTEMATEGGSVATDSTATTTDVVVHNPAVASEPAKVAPDAQQPLFTELPTDE